MRSESLMMGKNSEQKASRAFSNTNRSLFFAPIKVQQKLIINRPGDIYEQEADAMADKIMRMPDPSTSDDLFFKPASSSIHRKCANCEEDENKIQRKENTEEVSEIPLMENNISLLRHRDSISGNGVDFFNARTGYSNSVASQSGPINSILPKPSVSNNSSRTFVQTKCVECDKDRFQRKQEGEEKDPVRQFHGQPKLTISSPHDPDELEADMVAEKVIGISEKKEIGAEGFFSSHPHLQRSYTGNQRKEIQKMKFGQSLSELQRTCDECTIAPPEAAEQEEEDNEEAVGEVETVSPKLENSNENTDGMSPPSNFQSSLERAKGSGSSMLAGAKREMESGFSQDFSHVRIHTGSEATSLSQNIQAKAFTYQNHIFFNKGNFNPQSKDGKQLLAHELTHVVQQTGSRDAPPALQRSFEPKIGNWAHAQIQSRLRAKDNKLITEAAIPGGTRDVVAINIVGFSDLYKAENQTISGISAQEPAASKEASEQPSFYKYVNMNRTFKQRASSNSGINFGPTIQDKTRRVSGTFPNNFQIGEIKPLFPSEFLTSMAYHGLGRLQVGNYIDGFTKFAARTHSDNPQATQLPASITGRPLHIPDANIPDAINYLKFEKERLKSGPEGIFKRDKAQHQRIWFLRFKDGIYVYFLLPHPFTSEHFPKHLEDQLKKLDPLLDRLTKKRQKMGNKLGLKRKNAKDKHVTDQSPRIAGIQKRAEPAIQAKGENWGELGKAWEADRNIWVKGQGTGIAKPKDFVKNEAKGLVKKNKADEKLGLSTGDVTLKKQVKGSEIIRFWSSLRGRLLGALRWRFGNVFDKVEAFFDNVKEKFKKHHANSTKLNEKNGVFDGWKKVATKAIIRLGVSIFKDMIVLAFKGFMDCINGIVDVIMGRFTAALEEPKQEAIKNLEPVCCEIIEFKSKLENEFEQHDKLIATFTETVEAIREWRKILDAVETGVRIGVQILSCGTPPALGCLWGLVAQLGISTGLSLLARTDYFEEEIAKPAARALLDTIVGDSLHNFLIDVLAQTPLQQYLSEAKTCERRNSTLGSQTIGGNTHKLNPNEPKNVKAREQWELEHQAEILKDLQKVFEKGKGKPVTQKDLTDLLESIKISGKTPEEVKQMLMSSRNPASGKLNLDQANTTVKSGGVPVADAKERKFDIDKAAHNNEVFQQLLGWDPVQFVKTPGIKADSKEFAEAIYDMQKALGLKADGILGEESVIRFYERNSLKKDLVYHEAIKQSEKKKAKKDEGKEKEPESGSRASGFKVADAADCPIHPDKSERIPNFVKPDLPYQEYIDILQKRLNPTIISVDLYVNGVHTFRVKNVAVKEIKFSELLAVPENILQIIITLRDGFQLKIQEEDLIIEQLFMEY